MSTGKLGFGLMRLPERDGEIDAEAVFEMVDAFLAKGFTYFDTAYVYHGGKSERMVKDAIVDRHPRASFTIATKLPAWALKTREDVQRVFNEQLERTGARYFDYYLLHSIEEAHLKNYDRFGCWEWAQDMKKKGLIRHFGFSFHDSPELLDRVLTEHPEVEFVQLQINYADWDNKIVQSRANYEVALKHKKPIIIMEPVKGGMLASMTPESEKVLKERLPAASPASWALRFCASLEGVLTVLSGMTTAAQVADNLNTMTGFKPLNGDETRCLEKAKEILLSAPTIPCTGCRYCEDGCPQGIRISDLFRALNTVKTYGEGDKRPFFFYGGVTLNGTTGTASSCVQCGDCESVCPQHLPIREHLAETAGVFDKKGE